MKVRALFLFASILCLAAASASAEETITIATYYPSPYGVYNELTTYSNTYLARTSGSVGIGTINPQAKLEVVGGVKIGNDAGACDADKTGTLRYNSGNVQYCDGSSWQAVGGASYTYYCYDSTSSIQGAGGSAAGGPVCTDAGGSQGYCPVGYTQKSALGGWGFCEFCNSCYYSYTFFLPPGGSCNPGFSTKAIGQAYICSQ